MNPPYSFNDNVQPWTCDGSPLLPGKILDIAAPHGSAEWTNGPRGGITIEATNSPTVYEFIIGKRGDKSGWEPDENGNYIRYFSQAAKGLPMQWFPSPEEDIAVATQEVGLTDQDVLSLFTTSQPELIRSEISAALSAEGFIVSEDRLDRKLAALEAKGKLVPTLTGKRST